VVAILLMTAVTNQFTVTGPLLAIFCLGSLVIYGIGLVLMKEITWQDVEPFAFWRWR
jgi:hypothetical protein